MGFKKRGEAGRYVWLVVKTMPEGAEERHGGKWCVDDAAGELYVQELLDDLYEEMDD